MLKFKIGMTRWVTLNISNPTTSKIMDCSGYLQEATNSSVWVASAAWMPRSLK